MEKNILNSFIQNLFESETDINQLIFKSKEIGIEHRKSLNYEKDSVIEPFFSLVAPFTNESNVLNLIKSFNLNVGYQNSELIIVAHKYQITKNILTNLIDDKIILLDIPEYISLVTGCEIAANLSFGNNIVFLNSYLEIKPRWIEFLKNLYILNKTDVITFKILNEEGKIEEAGYSILKNNSFFSNGQGAYSVDPEFNYTIEIPSSSVNSLLIKRDVWDRFGFDKTLTDFSLVLYEIGMRIKLNGGKIFYYPLSTLQLQKQELSQNISDNSNQPNIEIIESKRPVITSDDFISKLIDCNKKNILVLGIYLGDRLNNVDDIILTINKTNLHNVTQKWVAINQKSDNPLVSNLTVKVVNKFTPKFEILNYLLEDENIYYYDYILIADDDIILPNKFLDKFIALQSNYNFALAQPARTKNSYIDHPIVQQQDGVIARQTNFVEIGPVFSIHKTIFDLIIPFDLTSPMGWGYENIWAKKISDNGNKMGIIDAISVDHSIRKPVENYNWSIADEQRDKILNKYAHFNLIDCYTVIDIKTVDNL